MVVLITRLLNHQAGIKTHYTFENTERVYLKADLEDLVPIYSRHHQAEFERICDNIMRQHSSSPRHAVYSLSQLALFAISEDEIGSESVQTFYRYYLRKRTSLNQALPVVFYDRASKKWLQYLADP